MSRKGAPTPIQHKTRHKSSRGEGWRRGKSPGSARGHSRIVDLPTEKVPLLIYCPIFRRPLSSPTTHSRQNAPLIEDRRFLLHRPQACLYLSCVWQNLATKLHTAAQQTSSRKCLIEPPTAVFQWAARVSFCNQIVTFCYRFVTVL